MVFRFSRAVDWAIVALAISAGALLWARPSAAPSATPVAAPIASPEPVLGRGSRLPASLVAPTREPQVVLFLGVDCGACNTSATFYRALGTQLKKGVPVTFVAMSIDEHTVVRQWLDEHKIHADSISRLSTPEEIGLVATPTLMIVENGVVEDVVIGALSPSEEQQFIARARDRDWGAPVDRGLHFREVEVDTWTPATPAPLTVDIRSREDFRAGHRDGSVNIPFDEVATRIPAEYSPSTPVVVDCTVAPIMHCRISSSSLQTAGFSDVTILIPSRSR